MGIADYVYTSLICTLLSAVFVMIAYGVFKKMKILAIPVEIKWLNRPVEKWTTVQVELDPKSKSLVLKGGRNAFHMFAKRFKDCFKDEEMRKPLETEVSYEGILEEDSPRLLVKVLGNSEWKKLYPPPLDMKQSSNNFYIAFPNEEVTRKPVVYLERNFLMDMIKRLHSFLYYENCTEMVFYGYRYAEEDGMKRDEIVFILE